MVYVFLTQLEVLKMITESELKKLTKEVLAARRIHVIILSLLVCIFSYFSFLLICLCFRMDFKFEEIYGYVIFVAVCGLFYIIFRSILKKRKIKLMPEQLEILAGFEQTSLKTRFILQMIIIVFLEALILKYNPTSFGNDVFIFSLCVTLLMTLLIGEMRSYYLHSSLCYYKLKKRLLESGKLEKKPN
jgi:hypothetical protein